MGKTTIEWADHSLNPIRARHTATGAVGHYCEKIASGCANCYASNLQRRFQMPSFGSGQKRDDVEIWLDETKLDEVRKRKKPTRYFWCDMSDLFGDFVPDEMIDKCFDAMWHSPQHTHLVLTKRPGRLLKYVRERSARLAFGWTDVDRRPFKQGDVIHMDDIRMRNQCGYVGDTEDLEWVCNHPANEMRGEEESCHCHECPIAESIIDRAGLAKIGVEDDYEFDDDGLATDSQWMELYRRPLNALPGNVWFGFSASDQATFETNMREFRPMRWVTPHITLFCSLEPLLGSIDFRMKYWGENETERNWSPLEPHSFNGGEMKVPYLNWVIVGGESGPNARSCDYAWIESIINQCRVANVPVFHKQIGSKPICTSVYGQVAEMAPVDKKGGDPSEWPEALRVRQFPEVAQ
ncbi:DUF5131 family protein [Schlesneria sp. T3-172]|uniref:DUF5131 family protein n=1 Tax=Schlesneria sphaerica TaxID=3373610 RepID=UPI0037C6C2AD